LPKTHDSLHNFLSIAKVRNHAWVYEIRDLDDREACLREAIDHSNFGVRIDPTGEALQSVTSGHMADRARSAP
jgi:hypothetical protein